MSDVDRVAFAIIVGSGAAGVLLSFAQLPPRTEGGRIVGIAAAMVLMVCVAFVLAANMLSRPS